MCTRIRFLAWVPGSRVPFQAPTIGGSAATIIGAGTIPNPGIRVNPNQSPNDNARCLFMVDLLLRDCPFVHTLFPAALSPRTRSVYHERSSNRAAAETGEKSIRHYPFSMPLFNHPTDGRVTAARPHHASSARIPLYGILATTSIHPTLSRLSRARFERARSDSSINVPELTKGSQRQGSRPAARTITQSGTTYRRATSRASAMSAL